MHVLVCSATEFEIQPTIDLVKSKYSETVDLLITGVGLTAASYAITKALLTKKYDLVIQAGFAGTLDPSMEAGKVVVVGNEVIGDMGVVEENGFRSVYQLGIDKNNNDGSNGELINNHIELIEKTSLQVVKAVSVNEISTNSERIDYYRKILFADIESMEGAALHYVCIRENTPFVQLRALSNFIGERNKQKWDISNATIQLNKELQSLISKLI